MTRQRRCARLQETGATELRGRHLSPGVPVRVAGRIVPHPVFKAGFRAWTTGARQQPLRLVGRRLAIGGDAGSRPWTPWSSAPPRSTLLLPVDRSGRPLLVQVERGHRDTSVDALADTANAQVAAEKKLRRDRLIFSSDPPRAVSAASADRRAPRRTPRLCRVRHVRQGTCNSRCSSPSSILGLMTRSARCPPQRSFQHLRLMPLASTATYRGLRPRPCGSSTASDPGDPRRPFHVLPLTKLFPMGPSVWSPRPPCRRRGVSFATRHACHRRNGADPRLLCISAGLVGATRVGEPNSATWSHEAPQDDPPNQMPLRPPYSLMGNVSVPIGCRNACREEEDSRCATTAIITTSKSGVPACDQMAWKNTSEGDGAFLPRPAVKRRTKVVQLLR